MSRIDEKALDEACRAWKTQSEFLFTRRDKVRCVIEAYEAAKIQTTSDTFKIELVDTSDCTQGHAFGRTDGYGGSTCQRCGAYDQPERDKRPAEPSDWQTVRDALVVLKNGSDGMSMDAIRAWHEALAIATRNAKGE